MTATIRTRQTTAISPAASAAFDVAILAGQVGPRSAAMYRRDVAAYTAWAAGQGKDPLSSATFARWRTDLVTVPYNDQGDQYSPKTINRMLSAVKRVVREGAVQGRVSRDVAEAFGDVAGVKVKAMKTRTKKNGRVAISPATMRSIVAQPDLGTLVGLRDRAFLLFLATSGVRVDDAVNLTVDQLEVRDDGFGCMVMGKNQEEPQFVPMTTEAYNAIQKWLGVRTVTSDVVFVGCQGRGDRFTGDPLSAVGAWKLVKKYAGLVSPQLGDTIKPHDFRRFVGTQLAQNRGVDVAQKVLGHRDARTTLNNYVLSEVKANVTEGLF